MNSADPGLRSRGVKIFSAKSLMEQSGVMQMKWALMGRGPGPALGPWKLLGFSLLNMHSPCFLGTFL